MKYINTSIFSFINENNNQHLIEVTPNKYVYHTSNPIFRDKISKMGLIPKGKSDAWLSSTKIDGKVIFAVNSDNKDDWWDSGYDDDLYRIDTTKLNNKWYYDPNFLGGINNDITTNRIITFEQIPKESIELIYKGTGHNLDEQKNNYHAIIENGEVRVENSKIKKLVRDFINHFKENTNFDINNIPKDILNKFPDFSNKSITYKNILYKDEKIYAGVDKNRNIRDITSWTLDEETAVAFSKKYNNGIVIELTYYEFLKYFKYFVSMDVIYDYIKKNGYHGLELDEYFSESEIVILKSAVSESIKISNPQTNDYNEIFVGDDKVGYIILAPARDEYYWVYINLPKPLAIVDVKIYTEFRGKNYMKYTMEWLYNFAKKNGYDSLFLRVDDTSEIPQDTLIDIYKKFGFTFYKTNDDDDDDIYMYKLL